MTFPRRALWFAGALFLFIAPWPGLGRAYAGAVGMVATAIADPMFAATNVTVLCRAGAEGDPVREWDAVLSVREDSPEGSHTRSGAVDLRRSGYLQLATFVALAIAWPPERRRALRAVAAAFVVVTLAVAIPIVDYLLQIGVVHLGAVVGGALSLGRRAMVGAPGMAYAVPALTWVATAHPLREWADAWLLGRAGPVAQSPSRPAAPVRPATVHHGRPARRG